MNSHYKYEAILDNINKTNIYTCKLCNKKIKSIPGFATHLKNCHNTNIVDYIYNNLTNLKPEFKIEKCNFCQKNNAKHVIHFNLDDNTYYCDYANGYMCYTDECINNICIKFFNKPYSEVKHKYEHIGAKTDFIAIRYKLLPEYVKKNIKYNPNIKPTVAQSTSLQGYIERYGKIKGTNLYNERCKKIAYSMTIDWYIERYGIDEGTKKYQARIEKSIKKCSDIKYSKNQYLLFNNLKNKDNDWEAERFVGGVGVADMVNKKLRVAIEYFGDYWHCNPNVYNDDFYNKSLNMTSKDCQNKDKIRLTKMVTFSKEIDLIIVVWEQQFIKTNIENLIQYIYNMINSHKTGTKEILWI